LVGAAGLEAGTVIQTGEVPATGIHWEQQYIRTQTGGLYELGTPAEEEQESDATKDALMIPTGLVALDTLSAIPPTANLLGSTALLAGSLVGVAILANLVLQATGHHIDVNVFIV